jgi:hypothetical protein
MEPPVMFRRLNLVLSVFAVCCTTSLCAQAPSLEADKARSIKGTRGSEGQTFQIGSAILNQTRRINIALPASYSQSAADRRYPVTIVLDGEADLAPVAAVTDELTRNGLVPESIIVAIENTDPLRGRVHDLTPPGISVSGSSMNEGGDLFLDFIEKELLPAVDRQFRGSAPRTLIGHSSGGILATYAAATRSTYRAVISIDAPIHLAQNWLARKLTARANGSATPLRYVSYEARFGWPDDDWKSLVGAAPASWKLTREKLRLEGHETLFMLASYLGLREVFSDYSRLSAPQAPTTSILPYYRTVGASFGAPLVPPKRLLHDVIEDFLMEGRGAQARDAYNLLARGYGAPADSADVLPRIAEVERRPPPTETVEALLATPAPTPREANDYIGDWIGTEWNTADEPPRPMHLQIRVDNGKVVGELLNPDAPEELRVHHLDYLRVTPDGLAFGIMNGMRPRGVLLWEGKRTGDKLTGKTRWGGIDFRYPPEMKHDPGFSLTRRRAAKT